MKEITLQTIQEFNLFKALAEKEHAQISDILEFEKGVHTLKFPLIISVSSRFAEEYGY